MECIHVVPRFIFKTPDNRLEHCSAEVYADAERYRVTVVLHAPHVSESCRNHLQTLANAFYRQELFRHLTPCSTLRWFCSLTPGSYQAMQLDGLPGGYTCCDVSPAFGMPAQNRSATG